MSTVRRLPHRLGPLRALVLLLVLLVPGAPAQAHAVHVVAGEVAEYDVLDTALRPPTRTAHRTAAAVPLRPAPLPGTAPAVAESRRLPEPPRPPYALPALRSVVLRC
ncbi:hypothetical protein [Streptomyces griseorubiginosus]|uniref:hypothetical protein n=1 Tax=Streptomyces griseorubiginosus TaxID=67304 RepID=UPI002E7FE092|nr:hypothetical protein [Streptomyces griseorubiginosus]WUB45917.1 hypothetical protein OHN19_22250 [Streptomyces griseorubiginosus]WUB54438.1 hypothetical protein OG942_22250 [Streptomyces griseorubiginosus]